MSWEALAALTQQGGPYGLLALVVISLIRGWLIPRSTHRDRIMDYQAAIRALEATVAERDRQIATLLGRVREPTS